jgi:hypothetical protein
MYSKKSFSSGQKNKKASSLNSRFDPSTTRIIYIPSFHQNQDTDWISSVSDDLKKYGFKSIEMLNPSYSWELYSKRQIWNVKKWKTKLGENNFIFWEFFPFRRFKVIREMNLLANTFLRQLVKLVRDPSERLVVICGFFFSEGIDVLKILKPEMIIADACDYWPKAEVQFSHSFSDATVTNSLPIYEQHEKFGNTSLISSGYFTQSQIESTRSQFRYKKKTVVFIGTINWRINFDLLEYCMNNLPDHQFRFYYIPHYDDEFTEKRLKIRDKKAKSRWMKLTKKPNFWGKIIYTQSQLASISIEGSVGILPYSKDTLFNRYCHPIKFYNYLALGIGVVGVNLKSLEEYKSDYIYFTDDKRIFCERIKNICNKPQSKNFTKTAWELALSQTVENKSRSLFEIIKEKLN